LRPSARPEESIANRTKRVSRKTVGLFTGLFTPDPLRGVIMGKLPVINRLMPT